MKQQLPSDPIDRAAEISRQKWVKEVCQRLLGRPPVAMEMESMGRLVYAHAFREGFKHAVGAVGQMPEVGPNWGAEEV